MSELADALAFQMRVCKVTPAVREHRFDSERQWRFDFAWPDRKVAVEVDGGTFVRGRHVRPEGFEKDCEKLNEAALAGWRVLRFTGAMVDDGRAVFTIERALVA